MRKKYLDLYFFKNSKTSTLNSSLAGIFRPVSLFLLAVLTLVPFSEITAQNIDYTFGSGTTDSNTLGISPFATINRNTRSQYLYHADDLLAQSAISGNIISLQLNITSLALPSTLKPENVTIKMGLTTATTLGTNFLTGLSTHYTAAQVNITSTGWFTFNLSPYFEWDGIKNIVVEICRNNEDFGTSFGVESELFPALDYRTVGLYTNDVNLPGCTLTGASPMNNTSRRTRPNMIMTMTQPCTGTPVQGQTVVTAGPYCSGTPFTLSIANGPTESGLYYQWQSSPNANGPWFDIPGANNAAYTTTQAIATFYRRQTICIESEQSIDALGVLVDGAGCYCTAQVDNANAVGITNVTFNTINNTTASTIAYNNYTTIQSDAQRGQSYNLSARVNTNGGTNYTRAWIDWNNDGAYQPAEGYNLGNVTGGTDVNSGAIASVLVPMDAVLGATNMRVRTRQSPANIDPAACGSIENGEGEDYTLNVTTEMGLINVAGPAADVLVYGDHDGVQVKTKEASIASIKVYDMSGRLLAEKNGLNANHVTLIDFHSTGQVLIFKIFTNEGIIINKKVIL